MLIFDLLGNAISFILLIITAIFQLVMFIGCGLIAAAIIYVGANALVRNHRGY